MYFPPRRQVLRPRFSHRQMFGALLTGLLLLAACSSNNGVETTPTSQVGSPTATVSSDATSDGAASGGDVDLTSKPEVVVPDGDPPTRLVIEDIVIGDGAEARPGDVLEMQYVGVLHDNGEQFDASWDNGNTFTFGLGANRVIDGWDEGMVGMRVGGRRLLSIPSDMAYGADGRPGIPGGAALVFVVDLVDLVAQPQVVNAPAPVTELEVTVLEEGDGDAIEAGDTVELHYVVMLQPTGVVIDSSFTAGESVPFVIGVDPTQSLPAWDEGLIGKKVGDLVRMVIPPELGFGERGADVVGPNDTIITEVRIMGIG